MVPLWVLKNALLPQGQKLPKWKTLTPDKEKPWEPSAIRNTCLDCKLPIYTASFYVSGKEGWRCRSCQDAFLRRCKEMFVESTPVVTPLVNQAVRGVAKGNLEDDEYRFWIGVDMPISGLGICRCCGVATYNTVSRKAHQEVILANVWPDKCTTTLVTAYKELLDKKKCVVCKGYCVNQRWGVPLCCQSCIKEWKFAQKKWIPLELAIRQVRRPIAPDSGLITSESTSNLQK